MCVHKETERVCVCVGRSRYTEQYPKLLENISGSTGATVSIFLDLFFCSVRLRKNIRLSM